MSLVSSIISVFESQILLNSVSVSIVLQINRDNRDKLKIIYLTSQQNILVAPKKNHLWVVLMRGHNITYGEIRKTILELSLFPFLSCALSQVLFLFLNLKHSIIVSFILY